MYLKSHVGSSKNNFVHVHKIFPLSSFIPKVRIQVLCWLSKPSMNGGSTCHAISVPMECWHSMQLEQSWSSTVAIIERLYGSGKDVLGKIVFVLRDKGNTTLPGGLWPPGSRMVLPQIPQDSACIHQYILTRVTVSSQWWLLCKIKNALIR